MTKDKVENKMQVLLSDSDMADVYRLAGMESRSISAMLRLLVKQGLHSYERR